MQDRKVYRLAIVDDEPNLRRSLALMLTNHGYEVRCYVNGLEALGGILVDPPDLAIVDIKMPQMDGIELLRQLAERKLSLPTILLTSVDEDHKRIEAYDAGGDMYVSKTDKFSKPFSHEVLRLRIENLLRRCELSTSNVLANPGPSESIEGVTLGDLHVDLHRYQCLWKKKKVELSSVELRIVSMLTEWPNVARSRETLMEGVASSGGIVDVENAVARIRKKFREVDPNFNNISAIYGIGYTWKTV